MRTVKKENKLCLICMEEHEVETIILNDADVFNGKKGPIDVMYEYCNHKGAYLEPKV